MHAVGERAEQLPAPRLRPPRTEGADVERAALDRCPQCGQIDTVVVGERDERRLGIDVELVGPFDEELVGARHAFAGREAGAGVDDHGVPAERTPERAQRLGDVAGADGNHTKRRRDPFGEDVALQTRCRRRLVVPPATGVGSRDGDVARAALDRRRADEPLDEDVDLAPAREADAPRLLVADAVGVDRRRLAVERRFAVLGDVGLDAAARNRPEEPARARHGELRAEWPRSAAACRDDGRERHLLALRAPLLGLLEHRLHLGSNGMGDALDDLLARVDAGELGDPLPVLAYLAGEALELDGEELKGARRRALLLVAAGGDPHRALDVDDRAVKAVAADLYTEGRREAFGRSIDALVMRVRGLPAAREAALFLAGDVDLAWRLYALGLLAEELAE